MGEMHQKRLFIQRYNSFCSGSERTPWELRVCARQRARLDAGEPTGRYSHIDLFPSVSLLFKMGGRITLAQDRPEI